MDVSDEEDREKENSNGDNLKKWDLILNMYDYTKKKKKNE